MEEDPNIPTLLVTDHDATFTNKYYNSIYDDIDNLKYKYLNITEDQVDANTFNGTIQQWIANIAQATALTIYQEIFEESYAGDEVAKPYYVSLNLYLFFHPLMKIIF